MGYAYVPMGIMADFCLSMTEHNISVKVVSLGVDGFYEVELMRCPGGKIGTTSE